MLNPETATATNQRQTNSDQQINVAGAAALDSVPTKPHTKPDTTGAPKSLHPYKQQRSYFIAALVLQIGLLSALTIQPAITIANGTTVTFTTAPVDPWDMFRGDYVSLAYDFSSGVPVSRTFASEEPIYVVLEKSSKGKWIPVRSSASRPAISNGEIVLKGKVGWCDKTSDGTATATVHYGIEHVYVPEGAGRNVRSSDQLQVDVAVGTDGSGVIKQLRSKEKTLSSFHLI